MTFKMKYYVFPKSKKGLIIQNVEKKYSWTMNTYSYSENRIDRKDFENLV